MIFNENEIKVIYCLITELIEEKLSFWDFKKFLEKYNLTTEDIKKIIEKYWDMKIKELSKVDFEEDDLKVFYFISLEFFKDFVPKKEKIFSTEEFQCVSWFKDLELRSFQQKISDVYNKKT